MLGAAHLPSCVWDERSTAHRAPPKATSARRYQLLLSTCRSIRCLPTGPPPQGDAGQCSLRVALGVPHVVPRVRLRLSYTQGERLTLKHPYACPLPPGCLLQSSPCALALYTAPAPTHAPERGILTPVPLPWSRFRGDSWQWLWRVCHTETHDISESSYLCLSPRRQNLCREDTRLSSGRGTRRCPV